jgi:hypothetical protein
LEDLNAEVEINSGRETVREIIKVSAKEGLGYYKLRKPQPCFDEGCSRLLNHREKN